jgi:hypothetical protein
MNITNLSQGPLSDRDESDMDESPERVFKKFSRTGRRNTSPSPRPSESPSEAFLNSSPKTKRSLNPTTNEPNGPNGPNDTDSSNYTKKSTAKQSVQNRFSVTSDHKPVFMEFFLREIPLVALTYNMSFASDLGLTAKFQRSPDAFPFSEAYFVAQNKDDDTRLYWKNAANLVLYFVKKKKPNIMFFQEMNDRYQIKLKDASFDGGYQALVELLAKSSTSSSRIPTSPTGSYYTTGIYVGIDEKNYGFLAYSIKKGNTFPTLLTIWDTDTLGDFNGFYGNDLGTHGWYQGNPSNLGRNFSCVITRKGVILINLHGPNVESYMEENDQRLAPAIKDFIGQAYAEFVFNSQPLLEFDEITYKSNPQIIFDETLVVIGGDTNDTLDKVKQIPFGNAIYKFEGEAPYSCCAEYYNDVLVDSNGSFKRYRHRGDKIYVHYTKDQLYQQLGQYPQFPKIFQNQLVIETIPELLNPPELSLAYGGRRHSRNLKKKKLLKKRKTIKKRHYKLKNKKSFKKRRIFRRKTRKHTHKQ